MQGDFFASNFTNNVTLREENKFNPLFRKPAFFFQSFIISHELPTHLSAGQVQNQLLHQIRKYSQKVIPAGSHSEHFHEISW